MRKLADKQTKPRKCSRSERLRELLRRRAQNVPQSLNQLRNRPPPPPPRPATTMLLLLAVLPPPPPLPLLVRLLLLKPGRPVTPAMFTLQ